MLLIDYIYPEDLGNKFWISEVHKEKPLFIASNTLVINERKLCLKYYLRIRPQIIYNN